MQKKRIFAGVLATIILITTLGAIVYGFAEQLMEETKEGSEEVVEIIEENPEDILDAIEGENPEDDETATDAVEEELAVDNAETVELIEDEELSEAVVFEKNRIAVSADEVVSRIDHVGGKGLRVALKNKGYYEDDINISMGKYINAAIMHDMTEQENEYIMSLSESGCDFERLIDVYDFLQTNNCDLDLLKALYDDIEENNYSRFAVENAYAHVMDKQDNELSMEDIGGYITEGLTADDILRAYEFSLRNDVSIRKLLDEKLEGATWGEISANVLGISKDTFAGIDELSEINSILAIARATGYEVTDALHDVDGRPLLKKEVVDVFRSKLVEIQEAVDKAGVMTMDDKSILSEAKKELKGLDDKSIEKYLEQGYRIRDIKQEIEAKANRPKVSSDIKIPKANNFNIDVEEKISDITNAANAKGGAF